MIHPSAVLHSLSVSFYGVVSTKKPSLLSFCPLLVWWYYAITSIFVYRHYCPVST